MQQIRSFIERLDEDNKRKFRRFEGCCLRIINATKAICFNENCIGEKLCRKSLQNIGINFGMPWVTIAILYRMLVSPTGKPVVMFLVASVCLSAGRLVCWFAATITQ